LFCAAGTTDLLPSREAGHGELPMFRCEHETLLLKSILYVILR